MLQSQIYVLKKSSLFCPVNKEFNNFISSFCSITVIRLEGVFSPCQRNLVRDSMFTAILNFYSTTISAAFSPQVEEHSSPVTSFKEFVLPPYTLWKMYDLVSFGPTFAILQLENHSTKQYEGWKRLLTLFFQRYIKRCLLIIKLWLWKTFLHSSVLNLISLYSRSNHLSYLIYWKFK